ncbi:EamA family transporter [Flavitalea flava]
MQSLRYYLAAITAFVIWGFFSFVLKPLGDYASLDILFYRVFLSAAIMFIISSAFRVKTLKATKAHYLSLPKDQKNKLIRQVLGGGLFLTANWFCFIYVTNHISVKAGSFAYLICPILTTVLAYFILKEQLNKWQWVSVLLSVGSCLLLAFNSLNDLLYSLATALSYALYLVSQRKNYGVDKFLLLTLQVTFSALLLLPFFPAYHGVVPQATKFYILITVIALFFTIFPLLLNLFALKGLKSSTVGILLYINPLVGFFIAVTYYHEKLNAVQVTAYSIIAFSVVLFNIRVRRASK